MKDVRFSFTPSPQLLVPFTSSGIRCYVFQAGELTTLQFGSSSFLSVVGQLSDSHGKGYAQLQSDTQSNEYLVHYENSVRHPASLRTSQRLTSQYQRTPESSDSFSNINYSVPCGEVRGAQCALVSRAFILRTSLADF